MRTFGDLIFRFAGDFGINTQQWMLRCDFAQFGYLCKLHFGFPRKKKLLITKLIFFKLAFTSKSEKNGLILCFLKHVLLILASMLSVL